jgi:hypothetical protein
VKGGLFTEPLGICGGICGERFDFDLRELPT